MNRDFLKEVLGKIENVDEKVLKEIIDTIMDENGKGINDNKSKIDELTEQLGLKTKESEDASKLIEELKAGSKDNEVLQAKITDYETKNAELQKELEQTKIDKALQVALAKAKVTDVDYVAYKVREKGELKLDDKGNLKGIDDTLKDIKTAYPTFFENEKKKEIDVKEIGKGNTSNETEPQSLTEALSQKYAQTKNEL